MDKDNNIKDFCKNTIHYRYWILILVLIIIAIASDRWTDKVGFTDYLSNAATMTSLVLGLVAIIYSFIANNAISSSLGSINSISQDIGKVNEQIGEYIGIAKDIEVTSNSNVKSMELVSIGMDNGLKEFSVLLRTMDEKNNAIHGLLSNIPNRLDSLGDKLDLAASNKMQKPVEAGDGAKPSLLSDKVIDRFFKRSSVIEVLVAYCCAKSWETKKRISGEALADLFEVTHAEAIESYLRCMDAVGVIQVNNTASEGEYLVTNTNKYFQEVVRDRVLKMYEELKDSDKEAYEAWIGTYKDIEDFYEEKEVVSEQ